MNMKQSKNKYITVKGGVCDVVTNVMNFSIVVSEIELKSRYYVHF